MGFGSGLRNVSFTGWVDSERIREFMGCADIGMAPYRKDALMSLPNKLFEYMSGSIPIVSSLAAEAEQFLNQWNCGLTYDPDRAGELACVLRRLILNPTERRKLGANGRAAFDEFYSSDRIYAAFVHFIESMTGV